MLIIHWNVAACRRQVLKLNRPLAYRLDGFLLDCEDSMIYSSYKVKMVRHFQFAAGGSLRQRAHGWEGRYALTGRRYHRVSGDLQYGRVVQAMDDLCKRN